MIINVYNGPGTERVDVLIKSIKQALLNLSIQNEYSVKSISPKCLHESDWLLETKLLIIPGGRDLPYVKFIDGQALQNIKSFIQNGGSYIGLCAGAYFSSSYVIFEEGTPMEVKGPRPLQLFRGIAKGSVYPGFVYNSTAGSQVVSINVSSHFQKDLGHTFGIYFNGGCEFLPYDTAKEFEVVATYGEESKISVVLLEHGRVLLSGVHPEMDVRYLDSSEYTKLQWEDMCKHAEEARKMFSWMLSRLLE